MLAGGLCAAHLIVGFIGEERRGKIALGKAWDNGDNPFAVHIRARADNHGGGNGCAR